MNNNRLQYTVNSSEGTFDVVVEHGLGRDSGSYVAIGKKDPLRILTNFRVVSWVRDCAKYINDTIPE